MAQRSLPQAGLGVGDAGPYTSDEWAEYFQIVYTGDQAATQGPLRRYLNELAVTSVGLTVTTATGAGFVYGRFLSVDTAVGINIALAAPGLERYDRVVMIQNSTNAVYNTSLTLPAAYAAGIPRNSARIAILQGTEAAVAILPTLLVGPTYYMVELARYLVTDAAVGAMDDRRVFCEGPAAGLTRTQEVWVMPNGGYNLTDPGQLVWTVHDAGVYQSYIWLVDDCDCYVVGQCLVPADYASGDLNVVAVLSRGATGTNVYHRGGWYLGRCGGNTSLLHGSTGIPFVAEAVNPPADYSCVAEFDIPEADITGLGDIMRLWFRRDATDPLDTVGWDMEFMGWIMTYTAWKS